MFLALPGAQKMSAPQGVLQGIPFVGVGLKNVT